MNTKVMRSAAACGLLLMLLLALFGVQAMSVEAQDTPNMVPGGVVVVPPITSPAPFIPGPIVIPDPVIPDPVVYTCGMTFSDGSDKLTVTAGDNTVTVRWNTENYDVVKVNGEVVSEDGQMTFQNVTESQTFYLEAYTNDHSFSCEAEIELFCEPPVLDPVCHIEVQPAIVDRGTPVTIEWSSANADTATIDQGIGPVAPNTSDTTSQTPTDTTTYTMTVTGNGKTVHCSDTVEVRIPHPVLTCDLSVAPMSIVRNQEKAVLTWSSSGATEAIIDQGVGPVAVNVTESRDVSPLDTTTYTLTVTNGTDTKHCNATLTVTDEPVETVTIVAHKIVCTDEDQLPNWGTGGPNITANTAADWVATHDSCSFAEGWNFQWGDDSVTNPGDDLIGLAGNGWTTFGSTNTLGRTEVVVPLSGITDRIWVREVLKNNFIPFTFNVNGRTNVDDVSAEMYCHTDVLNFDNYDKILNPVDGQTYNCVAFNSPVPDPDPVPTCDLFTVTPNSFTNGTGGEVTITWATTDATEISIDNGVGVFTDEDGSTTVNVGTTTTFTATVTGPGGTVNCDDTVTVTDNPNPQPLTCELTASSNLIEEGGEVTLSWTTTGAVTAVFDEGIGGVALNGSLTITPTINATYVLTATNADGKTVSCEEPVRLEDDGGGGGGGSSSPRCDLDISATRITRGEEITLTWNNTRTNDMKIEDNRGNVLVDTDEDDDIDEDEGSITLAPTRDTEYTMTVYRGSRERTCRVDVEVVDEVTVIEERTQIPQVAGISLSQVPYTGFEAGPVLTLVFYTVLALWAAVIAYILVVREESVLGFSLARARSATSTPDTWESLVDEMHAESVKEDLRPVATTTDVPLNLPTGTFTPSIIKAVSTQQLATAVAEDPATQLENEAHRHGVLLSSDAIRQLLGQFTNDATRSADVAALVAEAKAKYPTESGWLVLNHDRVAELLGTNRTVVPVQNAVAPEVTESSLAEAIVTGNVMAAFAMLGDRPMLALAEATADLDSALQVRQGRWVNVSDMLKEATADLSEEQLTAMITALTSALDGTYTDELAAVKMAIMKATKVA